MNHPFGGILVPTPTRLNEVQPPTVESAKSGSLLSRRTVLGWLSSAAIAPLVAARALEAADKEKEKDEKEPPAERALYYVMTKEGKKLSNGTLKKFEITGGPSQGWVSRPQLAKTPGYWAWIDDATAEKIRQEEEIGGVEKFTSEDIQVSGTQGGQGAQRIMVQLSPNGWAGKPKRGTFLSSTELAKKWTKEANGDRKLEFRPMGLASVMVLSFGPLPELTLAKIKESPQVVSLQWAGGGPGAGATNAAGEQGGPTTKAIGEEGSGPTNAQNEQGNVTTRAVGEEGGGAIRPPQGGVTTQALGEEGR